jgi:hypothetical protein
MIVFRKERMLPVKYLIVAKKVRGELGFFVVRQSVVSGAVKSECLGSGPLDGGFKTFEDADNARGGLRKAVN